MAALFSNAIPTVLRHEGGFSDDKSDPGGATNYGVSLRWLRTQGLLGDLDHDGDVDIEDIRKLTPTTAKDFYLERWWNVYQYYRFDSQRIATKVFDTAVNTGAVRAHLLLQAALGKISGFWVKIDGVLGPNTYAKANGAPELELIGNLQDGQAAFYRSLAASHPERMKFLNGWLNRAYDKV